MKHTLWALVAVAGVALVGCGGGGNNTAVSSASSSSSSTATMTDFTQFVNQQVQTQPAFGAASAAATTSFDNLSLGDASAFAGVKFGTGDALPAGTFQASVACAQAGVMACNPAVSADLNSTLN